MKSVVREKHTLHVLKDANSKLKRILLQNCNNHLITTVCEIIHNTLNGNISICPKQFRKLQRYKKKLRTIHRAIRTNTSNLKRREILINLTGGYLNTLANIALAALQRYLNNNKTTE